MRLGVMNPIVDNSDSKPADFDLPTFRSDLDFHEYMITSLDPQPLCRQNTFSQTINISI